jgi:hypothetical protein
MTFQKLVRRHSRVVRNSDCNLLGIELFLEGHIKILGVSEATNQNDLLINY